ncbi:Prkar2b, partial [Symbiodinium pilosum]
HELFIISQGSFDLYPNVRMQGKAKVKSAEAVYTSTTMTERLVRKQQFLLGLLGTDKRSEGVPHARRSMLPATNRGGNDGNRKKQWSANSAFVDQKKVSMGARSTPKKARRGSETGLGIDSWGFGFMARTRSLKSDLDEEEDETSPFQVGDQVAALVAGWDVQKELGTGRVLEVLEQGPQGKVAVDFPDGIREVKVQLLRPVEDVAPLCRLTSGECYGELSLLYNTRHLATCKAVEPSVVYGVPYKAFKRCFGRRDGRPQEQAWIKLLDEVNFLNPLVRSERAEVARNAVGTFSFNPNEMVMTQGEITEKLWFVVERGGCVVTQKDSTGQVKVSAELRRGNHFGERAIFLQQRTAEFSVQAGAKGMQCLVIDGELLRTLPLNVEGQDTDFGVTVPQGHSRSAS